MKRQLILVTGVLLLGLASSATAMRLNTGGNAQKDEEQEEEVSSAASAIIREQRRRATVSEGRMEAGMDQELLPNPSHYLKGHKNPWPVFFNESQCPAEMQKVPPFKQEFGLLVGMAVPRAYFYKLCGKLESTESCGEMSALYWFSPKHIVNNKCKLGSNAKTQWGGMEINDLMMNKKVLYQWYPAPFQEHFVNMPMLYPAPASKNAIFVMNRPPVKDRKNSGTAALTGRFVKSFEYELSNSIHDQRYTDVMIKKIVDMMSEKCPGTELMYHRYFRDDGGADDFSGKSEIADKADINYVVGLGNDRTPTRSSLQVAQAHPEIEANDLVMRLMSRHRCFLSVQGGDQHFSALFGKHHLVFQKFALVESRLFYEGRLPNYNSGKFTLAESEREFFSLLETKILADHCSKCAMEGNL